MKNQNQLKKTKTNNSNEKPRRYIVPGQHLDDSCENSLEGTQDKGFKRTIANIVKEMEHE